MQYASNPEDKRMVKHDLRVSRVLDRKNLDHVQKPLAWSGHIAYGYVLALEQYGRYVVLEA